MKDVELYAKVRHAVRIEGLSKRAVARRFGIDPRTVDKMLEFSVPPGYRRSRPPVMQKFPSIPTINNEYLDRFVTLLVVAGPLGIKGTKLFTPGSQRSVSDTRRENRGKCDANPGQVSSGTP